MALCAALYLSSSLFIASILIYSFTVGYIDNLNVNLKVLKVLTIRRLYCTYVYG